MLLGTSALFLALLAFYTQRPGHLSHSWLPTAYSGPFTLLRGQFLASVSGVTEDSAGLVAGLAIGDTSRLSSLTSDTMKVVSLTHLTAVSGANCAIVVGAIYLILRRTELVRWLRISFSLAGLVIYVLIVGPEPSVLRAAVMAGISRAAASRALRVRRFTVPPGTDEPLPGWVMATVGAMLPGLVTVMLATVESVIAPWLSVARALTT